MPSTVWLFVIDYLEIHRKITLPRKPRLLGTLVYQY